MALKFNCPRCGIEIIVQYLGKGQITTCQACGSETTVPEDASEGQYEKVNSELAGIRGWLILPAISFVLGPIIGAIALLIAMMLYPSVAKAGHGRIYGVELFRDAGLLALTIYAANLFFGKKRKAPSIIVLLMIVALISSVLLFLIALIVREDAFAILKAEHLFAEIIAAAIWIPYWKVSERVKATFVN